MPAAGFYAATTVRNEGARLTAVTDGQPDNGWLRERADERPGSRMGRNRRSILSRPPRLPKKRKKELADGAPGRANKTEASADVRQING